MVDSGGIWGTLRMVHACRSDLQIAMSGIAMAGSDRDLEIAPT
jgi:hypothetical protein